MSKQARSATAGGRAWRGLVAERSLAERSESRAKPTDQRSRARVLQLAELGRFNQDKGSARRREGGLARLPRQTDRPEERSALFSIGRSCRCLLGRWLWETRAVCDEEREGLATVLGGLARAPRGAGCPRFNQRSLSVTIKTSAVCGAEWSGSAGGGAEGQSACFGAEHVCRRSGDCRLA